LEPHVRDFVTLAVGWGLGYLSGIIKPVVSDWITDRLRARAAVRDERKEFDRWCQLAPELIEDLRQTMKKAPLCRDIIIVPNSDYYIDRSTAAFIYYDNQYPKVRQQALVLHNAGFQILSDELGVVNQVPHDRAIRHTGKTAVAEHRRARSSGSDLYDDESPERIIRRGRGR
jgi:hypothetical protein